MPPEIPRLYYPVKPFHVNQPFGFNLPCVKDFGLPSQVVVTGADNNTCPVGFDKLYGHWDMAGHNGCDLMTVDANGMLASIPVYAACDGVVIEMQMVPSRGLGLGIITNEQVNLGVHGNHFLKLRYWHLKSFYVKVGDSVKAGDLIGYSDNTGYSSGDHLHFEGQPMDKDSGGHPYLTYSDTATYPADVIAGAIDVAPFFTGLFAVDVPGKISSLRLQVALLTQKLADLLKGRITK